MATSSAPAVPPTKLSLILSGAASLGSFEAGVLTELLYVLDLLARRGTRCILDVITGASAGSMTAALVARAIMIDFADRKHLHDAWVERIDIRELIRASPPNALLSKAPIERIARAFLLADLSTRANRASFAPRQLHLGFTLSNMVGVDYALPGRLRQDETFTSTFFAERRRFVLDDTAVRDAAQWQRITDVAIASGNFPLAFQPAMVDADPTAWPNCATSPFPDRFCYVDGGILNNEPIREAIRLARVADGGELDPNRKFLLVDAHLNRSYARSCDARLSLLSTAVRLTSIIDGEATANDWLRARRTNTEIEWRNALLEHLARMVNTHELTDPECFIQELDDVAATIVRQKSELFPGRYPERYLQTALERTADRHRPLLDDVDSQRRAALTRIIFILNSIAGLDRKDQLDIDVIYAEPGQTAGDRLMNFGGFFNREWREFDFRVGRRKAHALLPGILNIPAYECERDPDGQDLYATVHDYSTVEMRDADVEQRTLLRDAAVAKVQAVAKEYTPGPTWLRWMLGPLLQWGVGRIASAKVSEMLELG